MFAAPAQTIVTKRRLNVSCMMYVAWIGNAFCFVFAKHQKKKLREETEA